ncbi:copper homeostasis periplasmic binding protein CopC [Cupriavidus sp. WKF15]|uniref:copper homeostasis periplasmic binding protein CopC n=1 Tax=Cupriavidus sp. WKF15 TaxID=3032282 RepID=UPI0023E2A7E6|nr:copper homeostasis periplasmic binding protein CopC [Cupriavidus sp. WKF15]WER44968.1 copper homeostasis periplasmic binding protein CopC [Cupriavidus sp. WKF15]
MFDIRTTAKCLLAVSALLAGGQAFAHPQLLASAPADSAEIAAPARIELRFSESLVARVSGAKLVMTGMPGMADHAPMNVATRVSAGDDPKTMVITPVSPLVPGTYRLDWRAVASDTHPVSGKLSFTVK